MGRKLNGTQALEILELLGSNSQRKVAHKYGVSRHTIESVSEKLLELGSPEKVRSYFDGEVILKGDIYQNHSYAPKPDELGRLILKTLPDVVLVIPDLQFPFAHPSWYSFLATVAQRYKPDCVVGIGDEVDNHFMSAYEKEPDLMGATAEYERALEEMTKLFKLFPKAYGLHSNHGAGRMRGVAKRAGLPRQLLPDYNTFLEAPRGWEWYTEVRLGDVLFLHGDGEKAITNMYLLKHLPADYGRHYSTVQGHRHEMVGRQAHIVVGDNEYWGAYTGCLINPNSRAFAYTKGRKAKLGCGLIVHGEYKQVRMKLDAKGNWTGEL